MKVYHRTLTVDRALYERLERIGAKYQRSYLAFSGGKESLVMATAMEELIKAGKFPADRLVVWFFDEEAIYPCVERIVHAWRERFLALGVRFDWICIPFKHYNCFNSLRNDESFILWDPREKERWVRPMPDFAVTSHPLFRPGDRYQQWCERIKDGPQVVGLRMSESVQRQRAIMVGKTHRCIYPIYDWTLNDVWLFLQEKRVEFPDAYVNMWKVGVRVQNLRISQFFSIDTASSLVRMVEFYPGLYERILAREPNAYLAMHYWDSEMFRRNTRTRTELEDQQDYEAKFYLMMKETPHRGSTQWKIARNLVMRYSRQISSFPREYRQKVFRTLYQAIVAGDPKNRVLRGVYYMVARQYDRKGGNGGKEEARGA